MSQTWEEKNKVEMDYEGNVRPVEIPSGDPNFDLDSFLDSLPGHLRMKVVQEKFGEPKATAPQGRVASPETALGASSWQVKVLVGTLVGLAVLAAWVAVAVAWLVGRVVVLIANYVRSKNAR